MRIALVLSGLTIIGGVLAVCLMAAEPAPDRIARQTAPASAPPDRADDEKAIRLVAQQLAEAYNAKDVAAFTALLTADAEIVDIAGHRHQGQDAIRRVFSGIFKQYPHARMDVEIEAVRFLGPTIAVEEGSARVKHHADVEPETAHYNMTYVKQAGTWFVASSRDLVDYERTAASELERLGWLAGTWIDENPDALIKTTYVWDDGGKYLVGRFTMRVHGELALTGTERIGWDPLAKKVRSWVFDSAGGFAEGLWTRQGPVWVLKLSGVTREGHAGSATSVYQPLGPDRYAFQSRDRVVGDQLLEDRQTTVVREPPQPGH